MSAATKTACTLVAAALALAGAARAGGRQDASANGNSASTATAAAKAAASSDTILAAMAAEIDRSKSSLKMDNLSAPYYVEYHVTDVQQFYSEAAFGAIRLTQTNHTRNLRVVVRVGDYKHDSYGPGGGQGVVDTAPIDNDQTALRRALWLATDRAYKAATQAFGTKQANLTQFNGDQGYDDFAHAQPLQSLGPVLKLTVDPKPWNDMLTKATDLFHTDPKLDSLTASARFTVINKYFVNSEGTVTRQGSEIDALTLGGSTQATDGMPLDRSPYYVASKQSDLPSPDEFQADAVAMVGTLKTLRDAPVVEEDYDGPVLFAPDAAADVVAALVGGNVDGDRPRAGDTSRTAGAFASSYKSRVLPTFLSATDDPTLTTFQNKSLVGAYEVDDEGVRAQKVPVIENGILDNYLVSREPIRDFPQSNGHGRAASGQAPHASVSSLILTSSDAVSADALKQKLISMCRDQGKPYGYLAATLTVSQSITGGRGGRGGPGGPGGPPAFNVQISPVLLYRVYVDGHQELVRGAVFSDLDTRSLRSDIVAAGNDAYVSNRNTAIPTTIITPSLLFDELEIRRTDQKNPKLPEYEAPPLSVSSVSR